MNQQFFVLSIQIKENFSQERIKKIPALSTGTGGSGVTSEPTARIIFLASITCSPPAFKLTETEVGEESLPNPLT